MKTEINITQILLLFACMGTFILMIASLGIRISLSNKNARRKTLAKTKALHNITTAAEDYYNQIDQLAKKESASLLLDEERSLVEERELVYTRKTPWDSYMKRKNFDLIFHTTHPAFSSPLLPRRALAQAQLKTRRFYEAADTLKRAAIKREIKNNVTKLEDEFYDKIHKALQTL